MNVPHIGKADAFLVAAEESFRGIVERNAAYIQGSANAEAKILSELPVKPDQSATAVTRGVEIFVPLKGLIDLDKEIARLNKELKTIQGDLARGKDRE